MIKFNGMKSNEQRGKCVLGDEVVEHMAEVVIFVFPRRKRM